MRKIVWQYFNDEDLKFYEEDEDETISNNAKILRQILNGIPLSQFLPKPNAGKEKTSGTVTHIHGDHVQGDKISDNTFGDNSINVIKSNNVQIVNNKFEQLYKEM